MKCSHCQNDFEENLIEEHHLVPRFMDNPKGNGMKMYLCEKCHTILHLMIPKIIWQFVDEKNDCINSVVKFTLNYCNKNGNTATT